MVFFRMIESRTVKTYVILASTPEINLKHLLGNRENPGQEVVAQSWVSTQNDERKPLSFEITSKKVQRWKKGSRKFRWSTNAHTQRISFHRIGLQRELHNPPGKWENFLQRRRRWILGVLRGTGTRAKRKTLFSLEETF